MAVNVCTGFGPSGYELYGRTFLDTFDEFWPSEIELSYYVEEYVESPRGECRSLWSSEGSREFFQRHKDIPEHCGRAPVKGWKDKDRGRGYAFRWDAVKWFRQILIPHHAASLLPDGDILVWFDADVVTFADVPVGFVESVIKNSDLTYIGRDKGDPELGFWAVRLNDRTRFFMKGMADCYTSDDVFKLKEFHSGHVFDHVMKKCMAEHSMTVRDLCSNRNGDIWAFTPLGSFSAHLKGEKRKSAGYTGEYRRAIQTIAYLGD